MLCLKNAINILAVPKVTSFVAFLVLNVLPAYHLPGGFVLRMSLVPEHVS